MPAQTQTDPGAPGVARSAAPGGSDDPPRTPSDALTSLAKAYGVATEFYDWRGSHRTVSEDTILAVLRAIGIAASTPDEVADALAAAAELPWRQMLPPSVIVRSGHQQRVPVHVRHGDSVDVVICLESGAEIAASQLDAYVEPRMIDAGLVGEATYAIPADLPLGYHEIRAVSGAASAASPLIVTPAHLGLPADLGRQWGFMTQLYAMRSSRSWGTGDLADLAELARWSGSELGAGFVLVNPLHAAQPVAPMEPSPYLPATRRFVNPLYLHVEDVAEVGGLSPEATTRLTWTTWVQTEGVRGQERLDRDSVWAAKAAALEELHGVARSEAREASYREFVQREGPGLVDFATWCALAEVHGLPWQDWPDELRAPQSPAVTAARAALSGRVDFYCWLQWLLDEQLAAVQQTALDAGMALGVVHDLAVGVHPSGADAWALQDSLMLGVSVGAPPDAFNQQGQDWSQPPWRPTELARTGYAAYRDMLRTILRHCGGLRVDHILGLFRLWLVPAGATPDQGTYLTYDAEAFVGILTLEAQRAGAVVVGEDLGVVAPGVRDTLRERGVLGTSLLWFERDWDADIPLPPDRWRELSLATVTTHDLPPTAGYLAGEHIRIRDELGLLTRSVDDERAANDADLSSWRLALRQLGLLDPAENDERAEIEALHGFLCRTPARLLGVYLPDAVGDTRPVNQPGTKDEYPNWRLPLVDGQGRDVLLEDLESSERAVALARVFEQLRTGPVRSGS